MIPVIWFKKYTDSDKTLLRNIFGNSIHRIQNQLPS